MQYWNSKCSVFSLFMKYYFSCEQMTETMADKRLPSTDSVVTLLRWVERHMSTRKPDPEKSVRKYSPKSQHFQSTSSIVTLPAWYGCNYNQERETNWWDKMRLDKYFYTYVFSSPSFSHSKTNFSIFILQDNVLR